MSHVDGRKRTFSLFAKRVVERYVKAGKYTQEELAFENILLSFGLEKDKDFFHNYKFKNDRGRYYWVDFYLPKWNLIIEIDGGIWHSYFKEAKDKDKRRDAWFRSLGFEVIRIDSGVLRSDSGKDKIKLDIGRRLGLIK